MKLSERWARERARKRRQKIPRNKKKVAQSVHDILQTETMVTLLAGENMPEDWQRKDVDELTDELETLPAKDGKEKKRLFTLAGIFLDGVGFLLYGFNIAEMWERYCYIVVGTQKDSDTFDNLPDDDKQRLLAYREQIEKGEGVSLLHPRELGIYLEKENT